MPRSWLRVSLLIAVVSVGACADPNGLTPGPDERVVFTRIAAGSGPQTPAPPAPNATSSPLDGQSPTPAPKPTPAPTASPTPQPAPTTPRPTAIPQPTATPTAAPTPASAPVLQGFSPTRGAAGQLVSLTGDHFSTTASRNLVRFQGVSASVISATLTQLVVAVPATATTGPISVQVDGLVATSAGSFVVDVAPPVVESYSPVGGQPGTQVIIHGAHLGASPAANDVLFNGVHATVTAADAGSITAVVPATATTGDLTVTVGPYTVVAGTFTVVPPSP